MADWVAPHEMWLCELWLAMDLTEAQFDMWDSLGSVELDRLRQRDQSYCR
jgi:hypothetical protein